jgi:Rod binding domain-containing protein
VLYVNPVNSPFIQRAGAVLQQATRDATAFRELEHFFAYTLLQEMQKTVPRDGLFDGGLQSDFQRDMFNDIVAGKIAESGQLGIAKMMEEQLRIQEVRQELIDNTLSRNLPNEGISA